MTPAASLRAHEAPHVSTEGKRQTHGTFVEHFSSISNFGYGIPEGKYRMRLGGFQSPISYAPRTRAEIGRSFYPLIST